MVWRKPTYESKVMIIKFINDNNIKFSLIYKIIRYRGIKVLNYYYKKS